MTAATGIVDLFVIGGGVNGAGIARDAAGRGLSVVLCEKGDLAEATSSRSGKLVHGGLRYLEYYEFRLVREALTEREVLLEAAPHIIWPLRFVLPHSSGDRPAWLVRLGLFLYDHLGGRKRLAGTRVLDLQGDPEGKPIKEGFRKAFEYADCWVDDSRLVVLNARDAQSRGADIRTRTACVSARRQDGSWVVEMRHIPSGETTQIRARALVNAAGPWVNDVIGQVAGLNSTHTVRLVKGSHIVVRKFWSGEQAYLVQNTDKRVIFIVPYEDDFALIGTTDIPYSGSPEAVEIDDEEIEYLLAAVNRYFTKELQPNDIIHAFSGVRPLFDDKASNPSAVTRDYTLELDAPDGLAPLLSVFGGKITTFRKLSEHAVDRLKPYFPDLPTAWTASAALPGGDFDGGDFDAFLDSLQCSKPGLPADLLRGYARRYGSLSLELFDGVASIDDLGHCFGSGLYEHEVNYLIRNEWARTVEDVLERRTKLGLRMSVEDRAGLEDWFSRMHEEAK